MATSFEATASFFNSIGQTADEDDEDDEPTSPVSPADTITRLEEIKEALADSVKALAKVFVMVALLIIFGALTIMSFEVRGRRARCSAPTRDPAIILPSHRSFRTSARSRGTGRGCSSRTRRI